MIGKLIDLNQIPEAFKDIDTVFHYCPAKTAANFILFNKELRLSPRTSSNDPIENLRPFISYSEYGYPEDEYATDGDARIFSKSIQNRIEFSKQICFCMNNNSIDENGIHPVLPHEYYGFLKPRMWDQYGEKYGGACLAFSREQLEKHKSDNFIAGEITYKRYSDLKLHHLSIDKVRLKKEGYYTYWENYYIKRINDILLSKHLDYKDEGEYRIISISESEYDYISIDKCLKGIVFSSNADKFLQWALIKHATDFKVDALRITWNTTGIRIYAI